MAKIEVLNLWLDHPKVGCGQREYLVLKAGTKWTRLLCIATATTLTVPTAEFRAAKAQVAEYSKARLVRRLRAQAATYGKSPGVRQALALVNGA